MQSAGGPLGLGGVGSGVDHADGGRVGGQAEGEQGRPLAEASGSSTTRTGRPSTSARVCCHQGEATIAPPEATTSGSLGRVEASASYPAASR